MLSRSDCTAYDVAIVGGGPAGSSLGRLLSLWGHRVLLVSRPIDRARGLAESIPPSASKLLARLNVLDAVDRAAFARNRGNLVWWAAAEPRVERFDGDRIGWNVFRPDLDAALLASASNAGVDVCIGGASKAIRLGEHGWNAVEYHAGGEVRTAFARFVADCSGRSGVLARRGLRLPEPAHRMQAYVGCFHDATSRPADDDLTLVETYDEGWAWSLPASPTARQVAVMVDGVAARATRGPTIGHALAAQLANTTELRKRLDGMVLGHAWARDASMYSARRFSGPGFVLVGDAGCAIDPLSSFGVKKALGSAWLAAVALHTALVDRSRQEVALEFFSRREREIYEAERARTREYARDARAAHGGRFWAARAAGADATAPLSLETTLLQSEDVAAAHRRLRASTSLEAPSSGRLRWVPCPVIRGREIVLDEALQLRHGALRFAADVDLKALIDVTGCRRDILHAYEAYCRTVSVVPFPHFLAAAALLLSEGLVTAHADVA